ncbi:hypothetical protein ACS0TY_015882 [Phlomoides rotata]
MPLHPSPSSPLPIVSCCSPSPPVHRLDSVHRRSSCSASRPQPTAVVRVPLTPLPTAFFSRSELIIPDRRRIQEQSRGESESWSQQNLYYEYRSWSPVARELLAPLNRIGLIGYKMMGKLMNR